MRKWQFICFAYLLNSFSGTWATEKNTNLIINGSFEAADCGSYITLSPPGSSSLPSWTVTQGTVDCVGSYFIAADGRNSVDLGGEEKGGISQTLATSVGNNYQVTFDMAGNPCSAGAKLMNVSVASESRNFQFDMAGHSHQNMGWVTESFAFTAKESQTTLTFTQLNEKNCGMAIDNVRVVPITDTTPPSVSDYDKGVQDGISQGIAQCKANPASCGIIVTGGTGCGADATHAVYNPQTGEVYIPFIDAPGALGIGTQVYEVYLLQRANSFMFDLDLTRVKPR